MNCVQNLTIKNTSFARFLFFSYFYNIMSNHKKDFQLERIILFSDAVFAIAITLLAIEIKVPELHEKTETSALHGLFLLIPKFIGFFISFLLIGIYWIAHHKIFSYVINYNRKLLWSNLLFLMFIVLLPFTTAFYTEAISVRLPFLLYSINLFIIGLMIIRIINLISKNELNLSKGLENKYLRNYIKIRSITPGTAFILFAMIQYFVPDKSVVSFRSFLFIVFLPFIFLKKYYAKKGVDVNSY